MEKEINRKREKEVGQNNASDRNILNCFKNVSRNKII